jgi:hypothetical protein
MRIPQTRRWTLRKILERFLIHPAARILETLRARGGTAFLAIHIGGRPLGDWKSPWAAFLASK